MSRKTKTFRVPSMDSRCKLADAIAGRWHEPGTLARTTTYNAWHKGYNAAVRDIRKALKESP